MKIYEQAAEILNLPGNTVKNIPSPLDTLKGALVL